MTIEQDIARWLEQHHGLFGLHDVPGRTAFIARAGLGELQQNITYDGAIQAFCHNSVQYLSGYGLLSDGRDPLIALLEAAKMMGGQERQAECSTLIERVRSRPMSTPLPSRQHRTRLIISLVVLLALLGVVLLWYAHSRTPQPPEHTEQQADIAETPRTSPAPIQQNITTLPPVIQNSATSEGDRSPAIVGDGATVHYK